MKNVTAGEQIKLFNTINIEIASKCNRTCYFCPNAYHQRPDHYMPWASIQKIALELQQLRFRGRIALYIYNEPTRDARLPQILLYLRAMLPSCNLMINTNGDYFKTAEDITYLFTCGLNQMQINIYSQKDASTDAAQFALGVTQATKRHQQLQQWVDQHFTPEEQNNSLYQKIPVYKRAIKVVKKYGIQRNVKDTDVEGVNHFTNRSGNVPGFRAQTQDELNRVCVRPWRSLNIDWNGNAILCCNDYYSVTNFGNVATHTVLEMWNHPTFNKYRLKLQNNNRHCTLCDKCDYNGGYYTHLIDRVTFGSPTIDKQIITSYEL